MRLSLYIPKMAKEVLSRNNLSLHINSTEL